MTPEEYTYAYEAYIEAQTFNAESFCNATGLTGEQLDELVEVGAVVPLEYFARQMFSAAQVARFAKKGSGNHE